MYRHFYIHSYCILVSQIHKVAGFVIVSDKIQLFGTFGTPLEWSMLGEMDELF